MLKCARKSLERAKTLREMCSRATTKTGQGWKVVKTRNSARDAFFICHRKTRPPIQTADVREASKYICMGLEHICHISLGHGFSRAFSMGVRWKVTIIGEVRSIH